MADVTQVTFDNPPFYQNIFVNWSTPSYYTKFERYTPNSDGRHHVWKSFEHYRALSSLPDPSEVSFTTDTWDGTGFHFGTGSVNGPYAFYTGCYGEPGLFNQGLPVYLQVTDDDRGFIPLPAKLDELKMGAFNSILPRIRSDLSLLNSLYELKDVRSVPRSLKQYKSTLTAWGTWFSKNLWGVREPLGSLLHSGADMYLQQKFNIAPLVSDINAVYRIVAEAERRLNDLASRAGRPHIGHYTVNYMEFPQADEEDTGFVAAQSYNNRGYWKVDCNINGGLRHKRFVKLEPSVFHCQLDYSFYYSDFQTAHAQLLGILDMLGVNLNPSIIWNAIPWSFVVDWVASVSRLLDNFRMGLMDPSVCLRRALWSIKRQRQIFVSQETHWRKNSIGDVTPPQYHRFPAVIETSYRRELFNPLGEYGASLKTSGLSLVEASLASALIITSRRRHRKSR